MWSPDGNRILYTSTAGGGQNLYSKLASGAGSEDEVLKSATVKRPTDWSSNYILYELVNASIDNVGSSPITVVVNWLADVKAER